MHKISKYAKETSVHSNLTYVTYCEQNYRIFIFLDLICGAYPNPLIVSK